MLTQEYLKSILHYNPDTGAFTWLERRSAQRPAGSIAGRPDAKGYWVITIDRKNLKAHRLAFLYMLGSVPVQVDHVNNVKGDNRWVNLRPANNSENKMNTPCYGNNNLGVKGVRLVRNGKFVARIRLDGVLRHIGTYETVEAATEAVIASRSHLHGDFARD